MKAAILLISVIVGIWAATLPQKEKTFLKQVHDTCQSKSETHADESLLKHMSENSENPTVMAHMLCMAQGTGMMTEDGTLDMEVIKKKMSMAMDNQQTIETMMNKCAIQKETPTTTAMSMWMCFLNNNIGYMHTL